MRSSFDGKNPGTFGPCRVLEPVTLTRSLLAVAAAFGALLWYAEGAATRALAEREVGWGARIRPGDLVFQDLACGRRCDLIRAITDSPYSHVGIVVDDDGDRRVWEAYEGVSAVPLADWVRRGMGRRVAVYRPVEDAPGLERALRAYAGRPYDGFYRWDDERIYCSELIAKAYARLGRPFEPHPVELGAFRDEIERLSGGRLTDGTPMVTPIDLIHSGRFLRVLDELHDRAR